MSQGRTLAVIAAVALVVGSAAAQHKRKPSAGVLQQDPSLATEQPQPETVAAEHNTATTTIPVEIPQTEDKTPALAVRPTNGNVLLPIGTALRITIDSALSTRDSRPGDPFRGTITEDVVIAGKTVIAKGAILSGRIQRLHEPRRFAGRPAILLYPESVTTVDGTSVSISATVVDTTHPKLLHVNDEGQIRGGGFDRQDKVGVLAGTGAGTVAGTVIAPGTGTLIGAAAGAVYTAGRWLWRRHSLELPPGTELIMEISSDVPARGIVAPATANGGN